MISPADRIKLIDQSLMVFIYGVFATLPVIGLIPAICAVASAVRLGARFRREWNPAAAYVRWGVALSLLNIGITILAVLIVALQLMPPFGRN